MSSEIAERILNHARASSADTSQAIREAVDDELAEVRAHLVFIATVMHRRAGTRLTIENCPVEDCQKSAALLRQLDPKGSEKP